MDAEILFFMSLQDQLEFLQIAEENCDSVVNASEQYHLFVGSCQLFFTPSLRIKNTIYVGKLEIRLSASSESISQTDQERIKVVYRKLRKWLKKNYWSRLAYLNQNKKNKLTPSRNYWLGPSAKIWKEADTESNILRLSENSWMVFELGY